MTVVKRLSLIKTLHNIAIKLQEIICDITIKIATKIINKLTNKKEGETTKVKTGNIDRSL